MSHPHPQPRTSFSATISAPTPDIGTLSRNDSISGASSSSDSSSGDDSDRGRSHLARPRMSSRKSSGTIIVPRNHQPVADAEDYPPDDARAMSPRRNSEETEAMGEATRSAVRE